jgi:hypothetical protein
MTSKEQILLNCILENGISEKILQNDSDYGDIIKIICKIYAKLLQKNNINTNLIYFNEFSTDKLLNEKKLYPKMMKLHDHMAHKLFIKNNTSIYAQKLIKLLVANLIILIKTEKAKQNSTNIIKALLPVFINTPNGQLEITRNSNEFKLTTSKERDMYKKEKRSNRLNRKIDKLVHVNTNNNYDKIRKIRKYINCDLLETIFEKK